MPSAYSSFWLVKNNIRQTNSSLGKIIFCGDISVMNLTFTDDATMTISDAIRYLWPSNITDWDHCVALAGRHRVQFVHGPLTKYVKLRVAHALGMPGTLSPSLISKETASKWSRHASRCVRHKWRGKRSRHSRRMHNQKFYISDKRSLVQ